MKSGIAPKLVASQVRNTAAWLWDAPRASRAAKALDTESADRIDYLRLLLAAHFATLDLRSRR